MGLKHQKWSGKKNLLNKYIDKQLIYNSKEN